MDPSFFFLFPPHIEPIVPVHELARWHCCSLVCLFFLIHSKEQTRANKFKIYLKSSCCFWHYYYYCVYALFLLFSASQECEAQEQAVLSLLSAFCSFPCFSLWRLIWRVLDGPWMDCWFTWWPKWHCYLAAISHFIFTAKMSMEGPEWKSPNERVGKERDCVSLLLYFTLLSFLFWIFDGLFSLFWHVPIGMHVRVFPCHFSFMALDNGWHLAYMDLKQATSFEVWNELNKWAFVWF